MRASTAVTTMFLFCVAGCDAKESSAGAAAEGKDSAAKEPADASKPAKPATGVADDVDLDAAKQALGCSSPKDAAATRACEGLAAFEKGGTVRSYPTDGTRLLLAGVDCSKPPNDMINFLIAELSGGGEADPGMIKLRFESWMPEDGKQASADRVLTELRAGKPLSELTPAEVEFGLMPKKWSDWKEKWEFFEPQDIRSVQTDGKSLLERSKTPAYWREVDGTLVRVAPPVREVGWCVSQFFEVPA